MKENRTECKTPSGVALGYEIYRNEGELFWGIKPVTNFDIVAVIPLYLPGSDAEQIAYRVTVSVLGQEHDVIAKSDKSLLRQILQQVSACKIFNKTAEAHIEAVMVKMAATAEADA